MNWSAPPLAELLDRKGWSSTARMPSTNSASVNACGPVSAILRLLRRSASNACAATAAMSRSTNGAIEAEVEGDDDVPALELVLTTWSRRLHVNGG